MPNLRIHQNADGMDVLFSVADYSLGLSHSSCLTELIVSPPWQNVPATLHLKANAITAGLRHKGFLSQLYSQTAI